MHWITQVCIIVYCTLWVAHAYQLSSRDSTDGKKLRSGMVLFVDHDTGVHYVGSLFGGITPRINADGTPYWRTDNEE